MIEWYYQVITILRDRRIDSADPIEDLWGGPTRGYGNLEMVGTVMGTIQVASGGGNFGNSSLEKSADSVGFKIFCAVEPPIYAGDVLEYQGERYRVTMGDSPLGVSGRGHHRELALRRIDREGV